jgi:uncharacterized protein HemY
MAMIDNLEKLLDGGRDDALLRYSLGNEYLKAEAWEQAIGHLRAAVDHDPMYSAAWKLYGKALTGAGRHAEAVTVLERGIGVAESRGDIQAAREMAVFRKRAQKVLNGPA